ncbi:glycerophosphoryl diester phosphodiesterase membrane domain-containing protein [Gordonia sp. DT219]|uniref:glycerophosphoryl diester phosphodiesterase membrane domain-containing protein n=1 Tax=Gordonia sp. DT219 TaxID=3416658 RepID=UPI003CF01C28
MTESPGHGFPEPEWGSATGDPRSSRGPDRSAVPPPWPPPVPAHKPGVIPLRPLGPGDIVGATFAAVFGNPRVYFGMSAVVTVATVIVALVIDLVIGVAVGVIGGDGLPNPRAALTSASGVATDAGSVAGWLLAGVVAYPVARDVIGVRAGLRESWRFGRPFVGRLIGTVLLLAVGLVLVAAPAIALLLVGIGSPDLDVLLAVAVASVLLIIPVVWLAVRLSVAMPAVTIDNLSPPAAIARSFTLTRGLFARYFTVFVILGILATVVDTVLSGLVGLITDVVGSTAGDVVGLVTAVLVTVILAPMFAVASSVVHTDSRIRKEGLDIALTQLVADREGPPWVSR